MSDPVSGIRVGGGVVGLHRVAHAVAGDDLYARARALHVAGFRLALVAAHDDGPDRPLRAVYLYLAGSPDRRVELHVPIRRDHPTVPTLAALSFPAGRFEREMHDLYGIDPAGHPLARRLVRHPQWPSGWYAMRRDAGPVPALADEGEPFPFLSVEGPGVYEIPVGPVHAGLIEPGHFRFSVVGETILKLKARLWYVHKGIEKLFEGRDVDAGIPLAERISGDSAVGHAVAYCRAVEDALGIRVPAAARRARAVLLELERLYNHIGDIGALCNDVGHSVLNAHALRIRETLLRLNAEVTGHRLLRGGVVVGGAVLRSVPDPHRMAMIATDIKEVAQLALGNSLVAERFAGTAVLATEVARELGTVGCVARASGIDVDARRDHPTGVLAGAGDDERGDDERGGDEHCDVLCVPVQTAGDVLARFQQRVVEIESSVCLLDVLAPSLAPGLVTDSGGAVAGAPPVHGELPAAVRSGVGIAEGWRGTIVHRVEIDRHGTLRRNKVVDPSFLNWPALPVALADTIVPDFPLVNKSFNLSYAGNDL
jgi:Ni,Fe-hydrogenase III large subunit/Ni,Fe-hydrogenase III component G